MPNVKQCGKNGNVYFAQGGGADIHVHAWTLTEEQDVLDSTDFNSGDYESHEQCRSRWSGSFDAYLDRDVFELFPAGPAEIALQASNERTFMGLIIVTSYVWTTDKSEVNRLTCNFIGDGALTKYAGDDVVPSPSGIDLATPSGS